MARPGFFLRFDLLDKHRDVDSQLMGDWLRMAATCARSFNDGRFVGAAAWAPGAWVRMAGVTRKEVDAIVEAGMARWDGDDLALEHYDHQGEKIWHRKSQGGITSAAKTNAKRWGTPDHQSRSRVSIESPDQDKNSSPDRAQHSTALKNITPPPLKGGGGEDSTALHAESRQALRDAERLAEAQKQRQIIEVNDRKTEVTRKQIASLLDSLEAEPDLELTLAPNAMESLNRIRHAWPKTASSFALKTLLEQAPNLVNHAMSTALLSDAG